MNKERQVILTNAHNNYLKKYEQAREEIYASLKASEVQLHDEYEAKLKEAYEIVEKEKQDHKAKLEAEYQGLKQDLIEKLKALEPVDSFGIPIKNGGGKHDTPKKKKGFLSSLLLGVFVSIALWSSVNLSIGAYKWWNTEPAFSAEATALMELLDDVDSWQKDGYNSIHHKKLGIVIEEIDPRWNSELRIKYAIPGHVLKAYSDQSRVFKAESSYIRKKAAGVFKELKDRQDNEAEAKFNKEKNLLFKILKVKDAN